MFVPVKFKVIKLILSIFISKLEKLCLKLPDRNRAHTASMGATK